MKNHPGFNPSRSGSRRLYGSLTLASLMLVSVGCQPQKVAVEKRDDMPSAVAVRTVAVTTTDLPRTTRQPASIAAYYRTEIRAIASGYVETIHADIGDYVESGALLAKIAVPELDQQLEILRARVAQAEAQEKQSDAGVELATARVASAKAKVAESESMASSAKAAVAASKAEFNRTNDLVRRGSLQTRMLDESRMKRDSQQAGEEALLSSVDSAVAFVTVAEAQLASAKADQDAAKSATKIAREQVKELEVAIAFAEIKSPFAGIVTHRNVEPGQLVGKGDSQRDASPLFVVSQIDKVRVRIPVPESDAARINVGDEVSLTFPSFVDEPAIKATVSRRSGSLDPSTRTMMIEADLPNDDGKLFPGMFGEAQIQMRSKLAANVLPSQAIRFDESGNAYVYVVSEDNSVAIASITTGLDDGNRIEITEGLNSGQTVIGPHLKRFVDGQKVVVLPN